MALPILLALACGDSEPEFDPTEFDPLTSVPAEIDVRSPEFNDGDPIPVRFTCDGADETPVINWQRPPAGTRSVALIMDDPDAPRGIFSHWVVFNMDGDATSVRELVGTDESTPNGVTQGLNDFGRNGYGGPCPPSGQTHEYRFNVFALIAPLSLDESAAAEDVLAAMRGTVIGHGVLSGMYTRQ